MGIVIQFPWSDTPGATSKTINMPALNFGADFAKEDLSLVRGSRLTYLPAPTDCPQTVQYSWRDIPNVYAGTGISKAYWLPVAQGRELRQGTLLIGKIFDEDDPTKYALAPFMQTWTMRFILNSAVTADVLRAVALRHDAHRYETLDSDMDGWFNRHMRKATMPADLIG